MSKIIIIRTSEYANRIRNFDVYSDGKKIGTIKEGETKEFNISPGQHSLITKIDWCSSQVLTFEILEGEVKAFRVGGFKNAKWLIPGAVVIMVLSLFVNFGFGFQYLFYFAIPVFLLLIYYLTIGKNRYLNLSEVKLDPHESTVLQ